MFGGGGGHQATPGDNRRQDRGRSSSFVQGRTGEAPPELSKMTSSSLTPRQPGWSLPGNTGFGSVTTWGRLAQSTCNRRGSQDGLWTTFCCLQHGWPGSLWRHVLSGWTSVPLLLGTGSVFGPQSVAPACLIFFLTKKPPSFLFNLGNPGVQHHMFIYRFLVCFVSFCLETVSGGFLWENFCRGPSEMSWLQQLLWKMRPGSWSLLCMDRLWMYPACAVRQINSSYRQYLVQLNVFIFLLNMFCYLFVF